MGCSTSSRNFVVTVASDATTVDDGDPPSSTTSSKTGNFNPFSDYLPFADFTAVRVSVEVLSRTPNMLIEIGGRTSNDGQTIVSTYGFAGDSEFENITTTGWVEYPFFDVFETEKYLQFGAFCRLTHGSSVPGTPAQVAVMRVTIDFKTSLTRSGD